MIKYKYHHHRQLVFINYFFLFPIGYALKLVQSQDVHQIIENPVGYAIEHVNKNFRNRYAKQFIPKMQINISTYNNSTDISNKGITVSGLNVKSTVERLFNGNIEISSINNKPSSSSSLSFPREQKH